MHLLYELSISEPTPAGGPIGLEKPAAGSNGGGGGGTLPTVEEEKAGWRRRKGGGVGGVCKKIGEVQGTTDGKVQLRQQHQDYKSRESESELHCCNLVICCVRLGQGTSNPG